MKNKSMRIFLGAQVVLEARKVGNIYVLFGNTYVEESTHMLTKRGSVIEFKASLDSISLKEN